MVQQIEFIVSQQIKHELAFHPVPYKKSNQLYLRSDKEKTKISS